MDRNWLSNTGWANTRVLLDLSLAAIDRLGAEMGPNMREIVIDTETTGLDPLNGDRIVEIGAVEQIDRP